MSAPDDEIPEADALEQAADVAADAEVEAPPAGQVAAPDDVEVPEGDAIEQSQAVPGEDEEDYPRA